MKKLGALASQKKQHMALNQQVDMKYELIASSGFRFDPFAGPDAAFAPLLEYGGLPLIMALDELAVGGAREAAVRATMLYQKYAIGEERHQATRFLMDLFAELLQADVAAGQTGPLIAKVDEAPPLEANRVRESGA
jgi:hypothetical protein